MTKRVEEWFAVRKGDYKLITVPRKRRVELYDVRKDPEEQVDLAAAETARVQELLEALDRWQSRTQQLSRGPTEGDEPSSIPKRSSDSARSATSTERRIPGPSAVSLRHGVGRAQPILQHLVVLPVGLVAQSGQTRLGQSHALFD